MRAGAAEKKAANGRLVARPIENGAHGEELIEREFAVKNVAAGEPVGSFEILRSDDLHGIDEIGQVRRVGGESFDAGVAQVVAAGLPVPLSQLMWPELHGGGARGLFGGSGRAEDGGWGGGVRHAG